MIVGLNTFQNAINTLCTALAYSRRVLSGKILQRCSRCSGNTQSHVQDPAVGRTLLSETSVTILSETVTVAE